jgi:hypothetical protein
MPPGPGPATLGDAMLLFLDGVGCCRAGGAEPCGVGGCGGCAILNDHRR